MGTKKLSRRLRQELITKEALNLSAMHGLRGFRIADLADKVGLVPAGIYRHFKGKNEIADSVMNFVRDRLLANVEDVCRETSDPLDRLSKLLERHLRLIQENPAVPRLVFSEIIFSDEPIHRTKAQDVIQSYLARISEIVREGQEDGQIRSDLDPQIIALMLIGLIQTAIILSQISGEEFDPTVFTQRAWRLLAEAIQEPSQSPLPTKWPAAGGGPVKKGDAL